MKKPVTIAGLKKQALQVSDKQFLRLISNVNLLLTKELGSERSNVNGNLINIAGKGEAIIIGDLHGDMENLCWIVADSAFIEKARSGKKIHLIFLGDYGDRGASSPEVYFVVLKLKMMYPTKVILMRGNHEGPDDLIPNPHDLPIRLAEKYGRKAASAIYVELRSLFSKLYNVVLIDKQFVLIHGGLPSEIHVSWRLESSKSDAS